MEYQFRGEMIQYKSRLESESLRISAELERTRQTANEYEKALKAERIATGRLRAERDKYAQLYAENRAKLEALTKDDAFLAATSSSASSIGTATKSSILKETTAHDGRPTTKGLDNCQLCNSPFDPEAAKGENEKCGWLKPQNLVKKLIFSPKIED